VPLHTGLLQRKVATATQTRLSRAERAANVANAFTIRSKRVLHDERVVLIDDVFTTGATTNACAKILCQNGAQRVCVWTVARGL
jgi:predicted amidophosphoribosyltransferase